MYVCMYVCVCVFVFLCMYACMYVCMYVCTYVYISIYIHICFQKMHEEKKNRSRLAESDRTVAVFPRKLRFKELGLVYRV
jgi:hypothetical protein